YESAIAASFDYMEVDASALAPYLEGSEVAFTGTIEQIIEQKWLALNSISSIEAWNDHRRLGIPDFPNSLQAPTLNARPLRLMYPVTERMTTNEEATKQGSDLVTEDKVWWDQ